MTTQDIQKSFFLLEGCSEEQKTAFFQDSRISVRDFSGGEMIQSGTFFPCLGVIMSGIVMVERMSEDKSIPVRKMAEGDVFGAATLFGGSEYITRIISRSRTRVMMIPRDQVRELIDANPRAAYNYILFLSEKVRYLNSRIDCYTAGGAKEKLEEYLRKLPRSGGEVEIPITMSALAGQIDVGRASLYRAVDALISDKVIERTEKGFRLLS